ncbi:MAG: prolipoprotein diacylglyceryl transferase [Clostridiales bacterium]|nr:prolipoprotein diacylglyceryl transferase [Clostridiales bacterium]
MKLLLLLLIIGMIISAIILIVYRKRVGFAIWQCLLIPFLVMILGFLSAKVMFFIENGHFDGESFFGTVFFIPIFLLPIAPLVRIKYLDMLDVVAPIGVLTLGLCKIRCLVDGCCEGIVIWTNGVDKIRFPCQICELITAIILSTFLFILLIKRKFRCQVYPIAMVIYGFFRFIWNIFRDDEVFAFGLPIGNLWAFDAFMIGIIWLLIYKFVIKKKQKQSV